MNRLVSLVDEQTGVVLDARLDRCIALDVGLVGEQTGLALNTGLDMCVAGLHEQVVEQFAFCWTWVMNGLALL